MLENNLVEFVQTDLSQITSIHNRIMNSEFDLIVNVAALTHIPTCTIFPSFAYESNTLSVLNILNILPSTTKLINFSTSSTYAPEEKEHSEEKSKLYQLTFMDGQKSIWRIYVMFMQK